LPARTNLAVEYMEVMVWTKRVSDAMITLVACTAKEMATPDENDWV
jgi:hypothetical protein